jgi:H/ACA ribonucleoprotein complex non-core subunit NAF1
MLMSGPAMMPAVPINSSMPPPVHLANQMGGWFLRQSVFATAGEHGVAWRAIPPMPNLDMGPE